MMQKYLYSLFALLPLTATVYAQENDLVRRADPVTDLVTALVKYPQTSGFSAFITLNPGALSSVLPNNTNVTLLIPSNQALTTYESKNGVALASLPLDKVKFFLQYLVLVAPVTSSDFSKATGGLTIPTMLTDKQYNNRSAGDALQAEFGQNSGGQVLYFSQDVIPGTKKARVRVRQTTASATANVRAGVSEVTTLDVVDGQWAQGSFQIVNDVLIPPAPCSGTIRPVAQLTALDAALNKTNLWDTLDHAPNVTCLAPNTKAFDAAGNPQEQLSAEELSRALLFHTLPMPLYSNFLVDGQTITSLANLTVKISVNSSGTYFNDARVVAQNVLTNNGVIHVLDKVMSPLNETATASPTASGTKPSNTASTTAKGAASGLLCNRNLLGLLAIVSISMLA